MTELDILDRRISELKEVQRVAWQQLSRPSLTTFDRCELRNQIRESDAELGYYLGIMSERTAFRALPIEDVGDSLAKLNFRLFA
jgi:hypothetical protein